MKQFFVLATAVFLVAACKQSYKISPSGLKYRVTESGSGAKLKNGQFIQFDYRAWMPEKDTTFYNTFGSVPAFTVIDSAMKAYDFREVLPLCRVGDEVEILLSVDTLKAKGQIENFSTTLAQRDYITFKVKIIKTFASEAEVGLAYQDEMKKQGEREDKTIADYLKKNNIKATKTTNGNYVQVLEQGSGAKIDSNTVAYVMYTGKLFSNGKEFDSNEKTGQPLEVRIGSGGIIPGWDESLRILNAGGKAKFFIPSSQAYGPRGNMGIPGFSILVFDIAVKEVKPAPAEITTPDMGMPPQ
jgi:FKBP-type peptidyl-prolyl cis-trans isomerase FkpA